LTGLKKNQGCCNNDIRDLIEPENREISIVRQCELLGISRSGYYYKPQGESEENLNIMFEIDKQYLETPFYGVPKMLSYLRSLKYNINIKRVRRLMRLMGLETIYCKPNLSIPGKDHIKYPYLLKGLLIERVDQVWSTDITYIPMIKGFLYLTAVIDWYSRYVLSWRLSNSLDSSFCIDALNDSLMRSKPEIFNTDQGVQFTSEKFTERLKDNKIRISMDSRGRAIDNIFIERLWRSLKYEYVYLHSQKDGKELYQGLSKYFEFYNNRRLHQALGYKTPYEVYYNLTK